jgi:hypothetical protein
MKNSQNYTEALNKAKNLPTHIDGELQEHYVFFGENRSFSKIMYSENANPVSVFRGLQKRYFGATRYYVKQIPTYREDGNLKKMKDWDEVLMFHKAWSRNDIEVKGVKFDIVGIKRQTTHLPAGVLIANVVFK